VYIICSKNQDASIKTALVIWLRNFVFRFPGAEGAWQKTNTNLINGRYKLVSLAFTVCET